MKFRIAFAAALLLASPSLAAEKATAQRIWVFDCGVATTPDVSRWSPGVDVGKPGAISNNCYMIQHGPSLFLWETGYTDDIAGKPEGFSALNGQMNWTLETSLESKFKAMRIPLSDVTHVAMSHMHQDHVGNAKLFPKAKLYIQEAEYDAAFGPDAVKNFRTANQYYNALKNNPVQKLNGDHDVFGDGSVVILSTPGHTPGHQSLLVRLAGGTYVLSGDVAHFKSNWDNRRIPEHNFNKEQTLASMDKIAALVKAENATLLIGHDKDQSDTIKKAPLNYLE